MIATGHGLDWVWPFSLAYPQEQIAIINDICVIHPKKELQPGTKLTIYQEHNPHAELVAVLAKFGYDAEVCADLTLHMSLPSFVCASCFVVSYMMCLNPSRRSCLCSL